MPNTFLFNFVSNNNFLILFYLDLKKEEKIILRKFQRQ